MKKQRVLFDMDGCLVNTLGGMERFMSEVHSHLNWTAVNSLTWDIFSTISDEIAREEAMEHMLAPGFFRNLDIVPKAFDAHQELVKQGHEVLICTTPLWLDECKEHSMHDKKEWVRQHLGNASAENIIFSFNKTEEFGDVIIDDNPTLTLGKESIQFKYWLIVDHSYNRVLSDMVHLPCGRINNDWSNWEEEFAKLELI